MEVLLCKKKFRRRRLWDRLKPEIKKKNKKEDTNENWNEKKMKRKKTQTMKIVISGNIREISLKGANCMT